VTDALPHRRKALPLTQSILWVPSGTSPPSTEPYLTFMHQRALNALYDHLRSSPDKGVLGFLLGHLYEDPPSSQRFAVIELVMRLTVAIYGDKTTVVVSRVWDKMQEELTRLWERTGKTIVFVTHDIEEAVYLGDRVVVLTARPARIKEDVPVRLPRPRAITVKKSVECLEYRNHIWDLIRSEAADRRG